MFTLLYIFVLFYSFTACTCTLVHKDVYHVIFSPPDDPRVAERLVEEKGGVQFHMHSKLEAYHRHSEQMLKCYADVTKRFCCDQPIQDLLVAGIGFIMDTLYSVHLHLTDST